MKERTFPRKGNLDQRGPAPLTVVQPNGAPLDLGVFPQSTITDSLGHQTNVACCLGAPIVNSDGTAYVENEARSVNANGLITSDTLYLVQINPDFTENTITLSTTTQNEALLPGNIIPDGNGGVLATWMISPSNPPVPQFPYQAADVVGGTVGAPYNLPFSPQSVQFGKSPTLVLGENGVAFASGPTTSTDGKNTPLNQISSFNASTGAANWNYQVDAQHTLSLISSTAGSI